MSRAGGPTTIVVIEDDADIAELVEGILSDSGHALLVRSGLGEGPADPADLADLGVRLVITDLVAFRSYDRDDARDWVSKVRTRYPRAAVAVATAHSGAAQDGAPALGADAVLMKPYDIDLFTKTVESLLDR